jgi:hypothetical protein
VLGDEKQRQRSQGALQRARGFVQREVGKDLHTRTIPRLEFVFDESIAGAIRMQGLLEAVRSEREAAELLRQQADTPPAPAPGGAVPNDVTPPQPPAPD